MIFSEKKIDKGFLYKTKDIFGVIEICSKEKLNGDMLDDVFMSIFNIKSNDKIIEGTVDGTNITYKFLKKNQWEKEKQ